MNEKKFSFELITQDENARLGKISTPRGDIDTPAFMPVGTLGTLKGIFTDDVLSTGTQIILGNTYHLMIRPGVNILDQFSGLHNFMNWQKPILTDSGGFQIMSLAKLNKIDIDIGAIFSSHIDGKKFVLSPEKSIQIQKSINSDIMMVLDECPRSTTDLEKLKNAINISTLWAKRCKIEFGKNDQKALFGIIQGGLDQKLRLDSLEKLELISFDGYAMGGLAVGETQDEKLKNAINISTLWAKRCKIEFGKNDQKALFGIIQGGLDQKLRLDSLEKLELISFDGYAMGGLAVGETQDEMFGILNKTVNYMPKKKPRYLMGVGTPSDILGAVKSGIDMFDCVLPTRSGRTGLAFTWQGKVNLRNAKYQNDKEPLDREASIRNLNLYSKSYLNHLIKTNEILASMLISLHNINFYQQFMNEIRKQIKSGNFNTFYNKYIGLL